MNPEEKKIELTKAVEEIAGKLGKKLGENEKLVRMFENCFVSTAKTTTEFLENGEAYIYTGDIHAMWLRDSSAQVVHYLPFMGEYPILKELVKGLILRQMRYICIDGYANAFNEEENGNCWEKDITDSNDWEWERKYEIDSLCYPVWLLHHYLEKTGDKTILTPAVKKAFEEILTLWKREQHHEEESSYTFQRVNCPPTDTLTRDGKGAVVAYTGMTWSGFRPSDDACVYGYLIPANMFAAVALEYMESIADDGFGDKDMAAEAAALQEEIRKGIEAHGIVEHPKYGRIYAYETDGMGNHVLMDDANVPSLLSLPWLGFCDKADPLYKNTRAFLLSKDNPFYFEGSMAKGIGSPHTPDGYIWHIALTMQGLTSDSRKEQEELLECLVATDGGKEVMHEGFDVNDAGKYTRDWFAWANSLFALYVMEYYGENLK